MAELPGPPPGRRRGPSTADPAATDGSALETRADALSGRCARCRGDLERAPVGRTGGPRGRETHKRLPACSENEHASSRTAHEPASASWHLACGTWQARCVRESIGRFQRSSRLRARLARRHAADSVLRAAHLAATAEMACPDLCRSLTPRRGSRGSMERMRGLRPRCWGRVGAWEI